MDVSHWLWLCLAAYAIHMLEEYVLDWRDWARAVIKLPVEWSDFYVTNSLVVVLGIVAANMSTALPGFALSFPALMIINALVFHILPVIRTRGRYSPGVFTAVVLFLPIAWLTFSAANRAGLLAIGTAIAAFVIGALLMAMPIVLLHIKSRPYFRQNKP
ncbi:MAG: HXXEE domain-containing protein [Cereibacter sphaeroides]|uniref:HXXEE domain-containing protein n=1 Tax=Cereibacter sphaeroides TaxID=1063 RepID=A0A2W5SBW6_CERSP|nr:MAG: HXXEE domain-containing protein [Cereibacter sphaeroides]